MIASLTGANANDFKQRYQGVIGWLRHKELPPRAVYVHHVSSTKVTFRDEQDNEFYSNVDSGVEFEFIPTQRAWYNTKDGLYYVQRIPARMWKRGICTENTMFRMGDKRGMIPLPLGADWRQVAFSVMSRCLSNEEAIAAFLARKTETVALNKVFAVLGESLFFFDLHVGKVVKDKNLLRLNQSFSMLEQELRDTIKRNNYPFTVEIA